MNYNQIMQSAGKMINPSIYYTVGSTTTIITHDEIISVKLYFNAPLLGTIMKGMSAELPYDLPTDTEIYFKNEATYGTYTANKVFGPYYVKESRYNADTRTYTNELFDEMLPTMVEYKPITINYPTTIYGFFSELVTELGYTTNISSLPNGNRTIEYDIYDQINFSFRDVLTDIGQATGSLFQIDAGEVKLATLGTQTISIDDDILMNKNIEFGTHYGAINTLVLARGGGNDKIYYPTTLPSNPIEYCITENQLMNNDDRNEFMSAIYSVINGIEYDLYDTELVGYGGFTPLDKISITTGDNTYSSYVFNNEQTFTQGYTESIYTEEPEGSVSEYKVMSSTDKLINQTNLTVNKQNNTISSLVSRTDEYGARLTSVEQNAEDLEIIISRDSSDNITGVKTSSGYKFDINGLDIYTDENSYNTQINNIGTYYKDGETIISQTTKDGTITKDIVLYGRYYYGVDEDLAVENFTKNDSMFVAMKFTDGNGEESFGHFWNGD